MSDTANEERGLDAGAVDYITKPISPPIVKARVKIHIQNYLSMQFLQKLLHLPGHWNWFQKPGCKRTSGDYPVLPVSR